jgi:hypothetical protein
LVVCTPRGDREASAFKSLSRQHKIGHRAV